MARSRQQAEPAEQAQSPTAGQSAPAQQQAGNNAAENIISPAVDEQTVPENGNNDTENIPTDTQEAEQQPSAFERVPKDEQGNPLYEQATPAEAMTDIYTNQGLPAQVADRFVANKLAEAQQLAGKLAKKEPQIGTDLARYKADLAQWQQSMEQAQAGVAFWQEVQQLASATTIIAEEQTTPTAEATPVVEQATETPVAQAEETTAEEQTLEDAEQSTEEVAVETTQEEVSENIETGESTLAWSTETASNGEPFLLGTNGSIDLIDIPQDVFHAIGINKSPFRLTPSMVRHVYERHKKELRLTSLSDAVSVILEVMRNFDHVRQGENNTYIFSIENNRSASARRAVTFVLEYDKGEWIGIKTLGYDRISNLKNKPVLWAKGEKNFATGVATANVSSSQSSQSDQIGGIASNQRADLSASEVTQSSSDTQASSTENTDAGVSEEFISQVLDNAAKAYDTFAREAQEEVNGALETIRIETTAQTDENISSAIADIESTPDLTELLLLTQDGLRSGKLKGTPQDEQELVDALRRIAQGNVAKNTILPILKAELQKRAEATAPLAEPQPVGRGVFGDIYDAFRGKAKEAINFLLGKKSGDLLAVFHRDAIGDIDLIWGDKNGGLEHILDKHVGEGKSFANIDEAAKSIADIINNGSVEFENGDKVVFSKDGQLVTIRKNVREKGKKIADKNWVLTAYDLSASDNVSAITTTNQGQAAPTTDNSEGEVSENIPNTQPTAEKAKPKADEIVADTPDARLATEATVSVLTDSGIEVVEVSDAEARALLNGPTPGIELMAVEEAKRRADAIESLSPIPVERNTKTKAELQEDYNNLPSVDKDGRKIEFYNSAFKKIYKEGGLFAQIIPRLDEILKQSVLAYSEPDNLGGTIRPDGTIHKTHPNVLSFDNYVGKVSINGKEYYVRTTVKCQEGKSGTHSFFVTEVAVYEKSANGLSEPNFPSGESDHQRIVDAKLQQFFDYANGKNVNPEFHIVYHGSGAKFDAFDHSHMGEGEGAQAYGWGTYLYYDKAVSNKVVADVKQRLYNILSQSQYKGAEQELREKLDSVFTPGMEGDALYNNVSAYLGGDKQASEFFNSMGFVGIKYPTNYRSEGNTKGQSNYVIFNEADAKIVNRVEFLKTPQGVVYGWTDGRRIYLTREGMNPETPIHEYTHLWARAMMQHNAPGWQSVKDLLRDTPVWQEVLSDPNYAGIHGNEDAVASEVIARLSGNSGAQKMQAMARRLISEGNPDATTLIGRIRQALQDFWHWVGVNLFDIQEFESVEEIADRVLWDMVQGTRLNLDTNAPAQNELMIIGEKGATELDRAEEATHRMDNLNIAREMETAGKDAKTIRMATGWERGADGKWRYEIEDFKKFDRNGMLHKERYSLPASLDEEYESLLLEGANAWGRGMEKTDLDGNISVAEVRILGGMSPERAHRLSELEEMEESMRKSPRKLDDYIDAPDLFKAYPQLRDIVVEVKNDFSLSAQGSYDNDEKVITLHNGGIESVLLHEVQHAIQFIEGFAIGGSGQTADSIRYKARVWAWRNALAQTAKEHPELAGTIALEQTLINEYTAEGLEEYIPAEDQRIKGFNLYVRGYDNEGYEQAFNQMSKVPPRENFTTYRRLAGEVEARNVQSRMGYTGQQRRETLLAETEAKDVARKDQIFLMENSGVSQMAESEMNDLISQMKSNATAAPMVEITEDNWVESVKTPIGNVKMGEHQKTKLFEKGREKQYGMVLETLSNPDVILEEQSEEDPTHERNSVYLFIKTFQKEDGSKYVHFESVTVQRDGLEVSISSHIIRENQLRNKMKSDRLLYKATALDQSTNSSAEQSIKGGSLSSADKVSETSSPVQESGELFRPENEDAEQTEGVNPELQEKYGKKNRYKIRNGEGKITADNVASALYNESSIYSHELRQLPKLFASKEGRLVDPQATISGAQKRIEILEEYRDFIAEDMIPNATKPAQDYIQKEIDRLNETIDFLNDVVANPEAMARDSRRFGNSYLLRPDDIETANEQFNAELDAFDNGTLQGELHLGQPGLILQSSGLNASEMFITPRTLKQHLSKHELTTSDIRNLPEAMQEPLMVYEWGTKAKSLVVITRIPRGDQRITVAVKLERGGNRLEVNEIASVYGKDIERVLSEMNTTKTDFGRENLKYVNKEIAKQWLGLAPPEGAASLTDAQQHATKIIENFDNPTIGQDNNAFRPSIVQSERQSPAATVSAEQMAERLGISIEIDESMPARGSYNPRTGRIRINPTRHSTAEDVQRTVLHEAIGHGGIQAVTGKHFERVCTQVYDMMTPEQRADIRRRHGNLSNEAVGAEYMAEMAETGDYRTTAWEKIKAIVRNMFRSMGITKFTHMGRTQRTETKKVMPEHRRASPVVSFRSSQ